MSFEDWIKNETKKTPKFISYSQPRQTVNDPQPEKWLEGKE